MRAEAAPTPALLVADAAQWVARSLCFGALLVLAVDLLAMLVAQLVLRVDTGPASDAGSIALGILGAATIAASAGAALWGLLLVPGRLALAGLYRSLARDRARLRDTVEVRGRASDAPFAPLVVVASCALTAATIPAIACGALLPEYARRADDPAGAAAANGMLLAFVASLLLIAASAAAIVVSIPLNRRARSRLARELPAEAIGEAGTPKTRARPESARERAARRRGRTAIDRIRLAGTALLGAGLLSVLLGVMMRKPSRSAPEEHYGPLGEAVLSAFVAVGAVLVAVGAAAAIGFAVLDVLRTRAALRGVRDDPRSVSARERIRAREATTALREASSWLLSWWFAPLVAAAGALFARDALPAMNDDAPSAAAIALVEGIAAGLPWLTPLWLAGLAAIVWAGVALDARGHLLRNAFGYRRPVEAPDDGPDITLDG